MLCKPVVGGNIAVLWTPAVDSGSSAVTACIIMASEGFQVGQFAGDDSQEGPFRQNTESASCDAVNPRVKRSAGLEAVGQYCHSDDLD